MPKMESKSSFAKLRETILSQNGRDYWRSVDEFVDTPEFAEYVKGEFPVHAETWDNSLSRRNFVKVMGASLALAGLSGCVIQPTEKIVPYVNPPEDALPGKPMFYATAMSLGGIATGLLAKSYEGRPIKVEGNPEHPGSLGATDALAQASILDLYDPDRSQEVRFRGSSSNWQNFTTAIRAEIDAARADGGAGVRFLSETVTSPTLQDQFRRLATELPNARWYQYEPINNDNAIAGAKLAFGWPVNTVYRFDQAERVVTLDADIFSGFNVRYIKDYAKARQLREDKQEINRLYAIESTLSLTGAKADHRLAVKPSEVESVARAIAAGVGVSGAVSDYQDSSQWVGTMIKDLLAFKGRSLVVAGAQQSPVVHALAHAINASLENVGKTVVYTDPLTPSEKTQVEQLRELVADIDAGRVRLLVFLGGNPIYNTPADLKLTFERLEGKVPFRVHLGPYFDETAEVCHWHVPAKHYLEMWSDARAFDGTASIVQPLIEPLYSGKSAHEIVQLFFRENFDKRDHDIVKEYWQTQNVAFAAAAPQQAAAENTNTAPAAAPTPAATASSPNNAEDKWRKMVHDGIVPNSALPAKAVSASTAFLSQPVEKSQAGGPIEFNILPDPTIYDGRFTNNGWLQELPNPINKITWENVALVSPATAARLSLNRGNDPQEISGGERGTSFVNTRGTNMSADLVTVTLNGGTISKPVPVWISPGQPDDVITLTMGYGRSERAGRVGGGLGYNAFEVMRSNAMYAGSGNIEKTGSKTEIASTQIHYNLEGRDLLRVFEVEEWKKDPEMGRQKDESGLSLYPSELYQKQYSENYKWAMSIDLNACVGCNACIVACQSENNIPVVGKEQVERSREMHWLRVDTYYSGDDINKPGGVAFQPILCQQCELAPCEVVCPVHATVHSPEGLNDMVYNRCVGTRYCSNNCPYKVRRFNFLLYQDWDTPQYKLMRNPEVTIRSRGVMEKCTFCTQRISEARIEAEKAGRRIKDGEVVTACQSVCPSGAIIFGDLNDPLSKIAEAKKDKRNYNLLNELNTQPRTTYMSSLKNMNPEMPDYKPLKKPKSYPAPVAKDGKKAGGDGH
ncbi:TAT-variant-translocated molybdopterin oxidoreductase [Leptolyngbya sp. 7M]|uniref:TAT-variant-translocated molybdopterin oxidoreductase n=1 Tax=Leptolyngbya sp. 7M TaxID=2812896 RepID=UPI001B8CD80E|nr:TAT-variant-translocated molybdopterin oxidoreductase [Leptolyngbya sp. 7M]QYO65747.1 TAT-variant-translocated molybdopterin oxidoreductase [Leptolyngbya sp. 7M]